VTLRLNKLPIYKGVACVEVASAHGARWWYAGAGLNYSPLLVSEIQSLKQVRIPSMGEDRVVVRVATRVEMLAINLARSDIAAFMAKGWWSAEYLQPPFDAIEYTAWPGYTRGKQSCASARALVT